MKPVVFILVVLFPTILFAEGNEKTEINPITITPLFFGPPTHEYPFDGEMTEGELKTIFDNMKKDGIKMVLLIGGWGEKIYYPSKILKEPTKTDWYRIAFEMALERNIQVVMSGVYYTYNDQFTGKGSWNPQKDLEINKKVYTELNERYGHYSSFWGWYIPHETGDRTHRGDIMVILENLPGFLKELTPNKKVAFSPWFPSRITLGEEGLTPQETANEWDTILNMIDGIDICFFQDSTAPLDELEKYFAAIKPVFDKHEVELSATIELFFRFQDRPGIELFKSISPELLFYKMKTISQFTERFACWEYQTHLYPNSKASGAKELNMAYRNWLNTGSVTGLNIKRK